jgi:hypothetical protein
MILPAPLLRPTEWKQTENTNSRPYRGTAGAGGSRPLAEVRMGLRATTGRSRAHSLWTSAMRLGLVARPPALVLIRHDLCEALVERIARRCSSKADPSYARGQRNMAEQRTRRFGPHNTGNFDEKRDVVSIRYASAYASRSKRTAGMGGAVNGHTLTTKTSFGFLAVFLRVA